MTNKEIQLRILDHIQEQLETTLEYKFGNGYYIFELGDDCVCHFTLPKRKGWLFGIWLGKYEDGKYKASLFGEYKDYIDAFKPTACQISYGVEIEESFDNLFEELYGFVGDLACIKDSNWASIIKFYWDGSRFGKRTRPLSWLLYQFYFYKIREKASWFWDNKVIYWHLKAHVFFDKLLIGRNFSNIEIADQNGNGFKCTPRYRVSYYFKNANNGNTYRLYRVINRYHYKNARIETMDECGKRFAYTK